MFQLQNGICIIQSYPALKKSMFIMLSPQEMYGMLPNQTGYSKQYDRKMKQEVGRMKMSVGEYYARKADMYETLMSGHDSKESQTQGNIDLLTSC